MTERDPPEMLSCKNMLIRKTTKLSLKDCIQPQKGKQHNITQGIVFKYTFMASCSKTRAYIYNTSTQGLDYHGLPNCGKHTPSLLFLGEFYKPGE